MPKALYAITDITGVEITSYSQANAILKGATIQTAKVRGPKNPDHGLSIDACSSCQWVLDVFNMKFK